MKNITFQIVLVMLLLLMGCSQDELINDASENNQLKKGSPGTTALSSFRVYGNSIYDNSFFELKELGDDSKILRNGKFSGSISGIGKINSSLSTYNFESYTTKPNNNIGNKYYTPLSPYYLLLGKGKVYINSVDFFEFEITEGLYEAGNWAPGYITTDLYMGGIFICNNVGQGTAHITIASGKFKAFAGRPLEVYRAGGFTGIDRISGKLNLSLYCRLTNYSTKK